MMQHLSQLVSVALLIGTSVVSATERDRFTLSNLDSGIPSIGPQGGAANYIAEVVSTAGAPYDLGEITWTGVASPAENPNSAGTFPSWGRDLSVRVTHDPSGSFADLMLGQGFSFSNSTQFSGSSFDLNDTPVAAGDPFRFEFFEMNDDFAGPDAIWEQIEFSLFDNVRRPTPLPRGIVRFSMQGPDTFPTSTPDGGAARAANYFGIHYGPPFPGGFPDASIVAVELDLHAATSGLWFDTDETGVSGTDDGTYRAGLSEGIEVRPTVAFFEEDPATPGSFGRIQLNFEADDFAPGDWFRFGIDVDGPTPRLDGSAWIDIEPPATVSVAFDNGLVLSGDVDQQGLYGDELTPMSFTDLRWRFRSDFNHDGSVDGNDFLIWQANFGGSGDTDSGDANGDQVVDGDDFLIWQTQFGAALPEPPNGFAGLAADGTISVPEPATAAAALATVLLAIGMGSRFDDSRVARQQRTIPGKKPPA